MMSVDDRFEWDPAKNRINERRHGLRFEQVLPAFDDPDAIEVPHERHGEERWRLIASLPRTPLVVVVVYTERGDRDRIISARLATPLEEAAYRARRGSP
jgi:uncharacterized DUF497 family protein